MRAYLHSRRGVVPSTDRLRSGTMPRPRAATSKATRACTVQARELGRDVLTTAWPSGRPRKQTFGNRKLTAQDIDIEFQLASGCFRIGGLDGLEPRLLGLHLRESCLRLTYPGQWGRTRPVRGAQRQDNPMPNLAGYRAVLA